MENFEIYGQLILAVVLGSFIGLERRIKHKIAGMRTFAFVSLGATLFTLISNYSYEFFNHTSGLDPTKITSQVVLGIGFIAGGIIIFRHQHVEGLTTGAGLWVAGGLGMAVAFKLYAIAIFTTALILIVFEVFAAMEKRLADGIEKMGDHDENSASD